MSPDETKTKRTAARRVPAQAGATVTPGASAPKKSTARTPAPDAGASAAIRAQTAAATQADLPAALQRAPKLSVLHQSVTRHLANRRAGTADTKTRDEVSGGGRKPWRQKGTGRARQGSIRSPLWRKGGVVFGPHPRSYAVAMNKKARRGALAMALSAKAQAGALFIIDAASIAAVKTKELRAHLWPDDQGDSVLVAVHAGKDDNAAAIRRAGNNLRHADVVGHEAVSAHAILAHDRVLITRNALEALAEVRNG